MDQCLALLRGINVGGKNIIKMIDLKTSFEALGYSKVRTYIQSGNVIFWEDKAEQALLELQIEEALVKTFDYKGRVVVCSHADLKKIVDQAPEGFGSQPDTYRYDVIFLKKPVTPAEAMQSVATKEGVDWATSGSQALYFKRLISRATQSHLVRLVSMPIYQSMTIRNWNTTTKLLGLMEAS